MTSHGKSRLCALDQQGTAAAQPSRFHGGVPGLAPGDLILPPSVTGVLTLAQLVKRRSETAWAALGYAKDDPALASVTRHLDDATYYAAAWSVAPWRPGDGFVYRVAPSSGPVRVPGWSDWTCPDAVVIEVVAAGVTRDRGFTLPGKLGYWLRAEDPYRQARPGGG